MSDDWKEEARARCEAASHGPWKVDDTHKMTVVYGDAVVCTHVLKWDAPFIAHARTDLPRALDELNAKDAEIKRSKTLIKEGERFGKEMQARTKELRADRDDWKMQAQMLEQDRDKWVKRTIEAEHVSADPLPADDVRAMRAQLGWSQQRLAKAMGMKQQNVSRAERETGLTGAHAKLLRILAEHAQQ